jgi:hypothetical protein
VIGTDKIRGVIENACGIFKTSLGSNPVSSEQLTNFFKCTFQYLLKKSDTQAKQRLARELDLEWQTIFPDLVLDQTTQEDINALMRDFHSNTDSPTTVLHLNKPHFIDDFTHSFQSPMQIKLDNYLLPTATNSRTAAQSHLYLDDIATSKQISSNNIGSGNSTQYSSNNLSTLNRSEIY